jgi:hypothetical protein
VPQGELAVGVGVVPFCRVFVDAALVTLGFDDPQMYTNCCI